MAFTISVKTENRMKATSFAGSLRIYSNSRNDSTPAIKMMKYKI